MILLSQGHDITLNLEDDMTMSQDHDITIGQ